MKWTCSENRVGKTAHVLSKDNYFRQRLREVIVLAGHCIVPVYSTHTKPAHNEAKQSVGGVGCGS